MIRRSEITRGYAQGLVEEHGSVSNAARALRPRMEQSPNGEAPTFNAVRCLLTQALKGESGANQLLRNDNLSRIAALLERNGINPDDVGEIKKIKLAKHKGYIKNAKREIEYTDDLPSESIVFTPSWDKGPEWPVVAAAKPTVVKYTAPTIIIPRGLRIEVISPDTQIGYRRELESRQFDGKTETHELTPMHDEAAIDVSTQIIAAIQPDGFTQLGDLFDFSEFSRYLQVEEFFRTTQGAIDYAHDYLANTKSAMGAPRRRNGKRIPKKLRLVDGNHDGKRLSTYIQQNARAAFHLKPARSSPESWPELTIPDLLRLDELGFDYMGLWPGSEAWLVEGENALVVVHDPKKKGFYQASVISGHTHHHRQEAFTVRTPFGLRTFTHYEIGCLCSLELVKAKGSIQRTVVPSDRGFVSGWTQGIAVVEILEDTGRHQLSFVQIENGEAIYQGQKFAAKTSKKAA